MGNIATTIDEQIEKLEQRGMVFACKEKAKEYLLDIGYYRLGFYWHYFQIDNDHNLKFGTDIEIIRELYYLDFDLKYLLSKYIYRIEVNFRTQLVYWTSNKHRDTPTWFIDKRVLEEKTIKFIENLYNGNDELFKKYNKSIKNHHAKYINDKFAPAWKTLEFFTFGQVNKVFKSLKDKELQGKIAMQYGYEDLNAFKNHIDSIVNIRNICSHNGILFDYNQPYGVRKIPKKSYRLRSRNQTNLNASIRVILNILSEISVNRTNELKSLLIERIEKARLIPELKIIIDRNIGFDID